MSRIVVSLGDIIKVEDAQTINAFFDLAREQQHQIIPTQIIHRSLSLFEAFNAGTLSAEQFRQQLLQQVAGIQLNKKEFAELWNTMIIIEDSAHRIIAELKQLQRLGHDVYIISDTNPLHFEFIAQQFPSEKDELHHKYKLDTIPIYLSYDRKQTKFEMVKTLMASNDKTETVFLTAENGEMQNPSRNKAIENLRQIKTLEQNPQNHFKVLFWNQHQSLLEKVTDTASAQSYSAM